MKTTNAFMYVILTSLLLLFSSCQSQEQKNNNFKPDIKINVNKEFDKYNNVVRYDSSYSYSYNGTKLNIDSLFASMTWPDRTLFMENGSRSFLKRDSLFRSFDKYFNDEWLFKDPDYYNGIILKDLEKLRSRERAAIGKEGEKKRR